MEAHTHERQYDYAGTGYKQHGSYWRLSWGAIFSGLFVALAIFLVLQLLGAGIGISTLDIQDRGDTPEAKTLGIGAGIWWLICSLAALFAGGWVSGYLANVRERTAGALHGLVLWGLMYLLLFWLVTTALAAMVGGTLGLIGTGLSTAGQAASSEQGQQMISKTMESIGIDPEMIQESLGQALGADAGENQNTITAVKEYLEGRRTREERQRLVQSIAQDTGKTPQEADAIITNMEQKAQQVKELAQETKEEAKDKGQKAINITGGSLIGLSIVMLIGAVVAILGAVTGSSKCGKESHVDTTHRHERPVTTNA